MPYRILLHTLTTGTLVAEVRPTAAKWSKGLNGAGSAQVTAPSAVLLEALSPLPARLGNTTVTIVDPGGTPVWSGVVWTADVDLQGSTTLAAAGMVSMLARRVVRSTLTYTGVDQATIAAALLAHAQDTSGGRTDRDLRISTASVTAHGQVRDRTYLGDEAKPIGEALAQLADVLNGFTFDITPLLGVNRSLSHRLDLTYPNTGVASTAVLLHRSNCLVSKVAMDATGMVTDLVAMGGGSAAALVARRGGAMAGWPCLEAVRSYTDVTVAATLNGHADRALLVGGHPRLTPALQVLDVQAPVGLNARCRLVVPEVGIDAQYRVLAVDTTLVGEQALSALTVANADLYQ